MHVFIEKLSTVVLVAKSHAAVLIRQRVEKFSDSLVVSIGWQRTLRQDMLKLLFLLASNMVQVPSIRPLHMADLIDNVLLKVMLAGGSARRVLKVFEPCLGHLLLRIFVEALRLL